MCSEKLTVGVIGEIERNKLILLTWSLWVILLSPELLPDCCACLQMLKCCHMQSLDPLPGHQSSPSHQAHQHEPPKCQIFNNQSNSMPNLLHETGSQTISFAQWQPCTRRSSTWGMNVRYLSCCVEEKQRGAVYLQKFSLCLELIVPWETNTMQNRSRRRGSANGTQTQKPTPQHSHCGLRA